MIGVDGEQLRRGIHLHVLHRGREIFQVLDGFRFGTLHHIVVGIHIDDATLLPKSKTRTSPSGGKGRRTLPCDEVLLIGGDTHARGRVTAIVGETMDRCATANIEHGDDPFV